MSSKLMRVMFFLCALMLTVMVTTACSASKPTIIITSPPSGSQYNEGEEIKVQSTTTDSSGVDRVELIVDGIPVRTDPSPSPQVSFTVIQSWKATQGAHVVSVRAYNKSGGVSDVAAISINVAQSVALNATPTSLPPLPGSPVPPGTTPTAPAGATPGTGSCVNSATFVADVTIPDGMTIAAGQTFNKTWRLSNNGTCTWTGYEFVFISGEAMTTGTVIPVPNLAPGGTVDVTVPMTAPSTAGPHSGNWRMRAGGGTVFGTTVRVLITVPGAPVPTQTAVVPTNTPVPTGCSGAPVIASFTASANPIAVGASTTLQCGAVTNADSVEINQSIGGVASPGTVVVAPSSTITYTMTARCGTAQTVRQLMVTVNPGLPAPVAVIYDFIGKANVASDKWQSSGSLGNFDLAFPGVDTDTKGFALWRDNFKLNDGSQPARVLETHPQWTPSGIISRCYRDLWDSGYTVQSSDRVSGKVGFLQNATAGNVTFRVRLRGESLPNNDIAVIPLVYADGVKSFNVQIGTLNSGQYVGRKADICLIVEAGADAGQDWAVWQDVRLTRGGP